MSTVIVCEGHPVDNRRPSPDFSIQRHPSCCTPLHPSPGRHRAPRLTTVMREGGPLCSTETQAWDSNALSSFGGGSRHTVGSDALRGHGYPHNPPDICTNGMGFGVDLRTKRHVEE
ncbi:unnamed protein product [Arctogadus glacialis]